MRKRTINYNFMRIVLIGIVLVLTSMITSVNAQNVDPKSVNVESLSDSQIKQIVDEISKRGLSESEAIGLARARGLSSEQISMLKRRLNEVQNQSIAGNKSNNRSLSNDQNDADLLSAKSSIDSTQVDNRIFGFSFFNNENLTFEPSLNIPVPDSYILGSGDELLIDIWGASQQSYQETIGSDGKINIPFVGPCYVGGMKLNDAKKQILDLLSTIYADLKSDNPRTFASIRTGQLKVIRVNVVGEVFNPGSYTLPGTASLFNVLYLSGGPNKTGSFRDVQLIRNGKIINHLDIYDFLINGNTMVNVPLMDNDIVMIPTYINRVRVGGEFKRIGIFEVVEDESVADLVKYAGGYTESAYNNKLRLYRSNGKEREFKSINQNNIEQIILQAGDSLFVGKILDRYSNMVTIDGAVFNPGNYEYTQGLTLNGLIEKADGVIENAFLSRGVITRTKQDFTKESLSFDVEKILKGVDNIPLKPNDEVLIAAIDSMREERTVAIWGEVQNMGMYQYAENITLGDLVFIAGGFKESASESTIEVMRRLPYAEADKSNGKTSDIYRFQVSRNLKLGDEGASFVLKPFDEVFIRFMPGFQKSGVVTVLGQVMYSGNYGLSSRTEKISDVVKRAGGLSANAYPLGAKLTRPKHLTEEEKAQRKEMMRKDTTLYFSDLEFETVSINLEKILTSPGSKDDIYMQNGDVLEIPSLLQTVQVSGEVLNPSSTVFVKGYKVRRYVQNSGGFAVSAKRGKTYVLYPNGSSSATKGFLFFRSYPKVSPGAEIVIPKKPERLGMPPQAWIAIASSLASIGLTIATIANMNN
nr:SLBB domain-containing protein [uncultured Carboxylicivirga sp.]